MPFKCVVKHYAPDATVRRNVVDLGVTVVDFACQILTVVQTFGEIKVDGAKPPRNRKIRITVWSFQCQVILILLYKSRRVCPLKKGILSIVSMKRRETKKY